MTIFAYTVGQSLADSLSDEALVRLLPALSRRAAELTLAELVKSVRSGGA